MKQMKTIYFILFLLVIQLAFSGLEKDVTIKRRNLKVDLNSNRDDYRSNIPLTIAHQGLIKEDAIPVIGNHDLSFTIYSVATGGTPLWTEIQSAVTFSDGIFNVILGSVIPLNLDFDIQYYIGVTLDSGDEFSPRVQLTTSPYAFNSKKADLANVASDIETDVAVTSLNGKQNSVSITAGENIAIDNSGADIIISADLSSVTDNDELVKVGAAGDPGYLSNSDFTSSTKEISKKSNTKDAISNSRSNKGVISIKENAITESKLDIDNSASDGYALTYDSGTSKMMWKDVDTLVDGDNLGNHTATQNIRLNGNILSNDGSPNGLSIENDGEIYILREGAAKIIMSYQGMSMNDVDWGVYINKANGYGFKIARAGNPSWPLVSNLNNGFEVQGAEDFGMFIGRADSTGINIESTGYDGIVVKNAGNPTSSRSAESLKNGIEIQGAEGHGVYVGHSDESAFYAKHSHLSGLYVDSVGTGVYVNHSNGSGLTVFSAGNALTYSFSGTSHGLEVNGVTGDGVYIGRAGRNGMRIHSSVQDAIIIDYAGNPFSAIYSDLNNGLEVAGSEGNGIFIGKAEVSGIEINTAAEDGIKVIQVGTGQTPLPSGFRNGLEIQASSGNGVYVGNVATSGIEIQHSGADGIRIMEAGNPSTTQYSNLRNGLEIQGAEGDGVYIGQADNCGIEIINTGSNGIKMVNITKDGVAIENTLNDGFQINKAGTPSTFVASNLNNGLEVQGAEGNGVYIGQSDENGIQIIRAEKYGLKIDYAGYSGVSVNSAVAIGVYLNSIGSNGFHVANAGSNGVYVGQAENGITVNTTNELGLKVTSAGTDGIYIVESGDDGATIYGDDKGVIGATTNVNDEYGIYTNDKMYCGAGYMGSKMFSVGKNTGSETLEPGDLVVFAGGYEEEVLGEKGEIPVINVKKADKNSSNSLFGVVEYSVEIKEEFEEVKAGMTRIEKSFTKADYDEARSGDYLSIVVFGPADVKVGDRAENILTGESLKGSDNAGVQKVKTAMVSGIEIAENVGIVGKALEDSNGRGMIKVFVNCK